MCQAHFRGNPKGVGPNDIPSIFAWSKLTTPRTTKGRSALSFRSNHDDTAENVSTGPNTNLVSEEVSVAADVSSKPGYHLHLLADTALKESSSRTQIHCEHALDNVDSNKSGIELLTEACFLHGVSPLSQDDKAAECQQSNNKYIKSLEKKYSMILKPRN